MNMSINEAHAAVKAFAMYAYNRAPSQIVKKLFPTASEAYISEKTEYIDKYGIASYMGQLDDYNSKKLIEHALEAYGEYTLSQM
jgi:hypothetical protein